MTMSKPVAGNTNPQLPVDMLVLSRVLTRSFTLPLSLLVLCEVMAVVREKMPRPSDPPRMVSRACGNVHAVPRLVSMLTALPSGLRIHLGSAALLTQTALCASQACTWYMRASLPLAYPRV